MFRHYIVIQMQVRRVGSNVQLQGNSSGVSYTVDIANWRGAKVILQRLVLEFLITLSVG